MPPPRRRANTTKFAVGFLAGLVIVGLMNLNLIGEVRNQSSDSGGRSGAAEIVNVSRVIPTSDNDPRAGNRQRPEIIKR